MVDPGCTSARAIELFAESCERLNAFARELRSRGTYADVRTHADIRRYTSGWRLEKSVEADVSASDGYVATWCLELSQPADKWVVSLSVNVSHSEVYLDLGNRMAHSVDELEITLDEAVGVLMSAADPGSEFAESIDRLSRRE